MSLTLSDVKRIANLAQLDMDEAHAQTALTELNGILKAVKPCKHRTNRMQFGGENHLYSAYKRQIIR